MADSEQRYEDTHAEAILREAARLSGQQSLYTRRSLEEAAAELGISADQLDAAEKAVQVRRDLESDLNEFNLRKRSDLKNEWTTYFSVNAMLIGINLFTMQFRIGSIWELWALWPIMCWGIPLLVKTLRGEGKPATENDPDFQKWRRKKMRKTEFTQRLVPGVPLKNAGDVLDHYFSMHRVDNKLEAIKYVRDEMSMNLNDAKMVVDEYYRVRGLE
jgi:hypothetical protein